MVQGILRGGHLQCPVMVHLRIVSPQDTTERALEALEGCRSVINLILLADAARRPDGDVIMCDVAREEASVVIADLRALEIDHRGSIAVEQIDTVVSDAADQAEREARGAPSDAVVWEEVSERTSETATLSAVFLIFMVLASCIAAVGIFLDSPILIVGAMVVGPEFGPLAGFCVAAVQRRPALAVRSFVALAVGFPVAAIAGERQRGTLEVLLARPVSRRSLYITDFLVGMLFLGVMLALELTANVVSSAAMGVLDEITVANVPILWFNGWLLFVAFMAVAFAASVSFDRLGPPLGIALAVLLVAYVIDVIASLWPDAKGIGAYSLFHYVKAKPVLNGSLAVADLALLVLIIALAVAAALWIFPRRDIAAPS